MRQTAIPGMLPQRDESIEEAIQKYQDAKQASQRAADAMRVAHAELAQLMVERKSARYEMRVGQRSVFASLDLPDPVVRIKVLEVEDGDAE